MLSYLPTAFPCGDERHSQVDHTWVHCLAALQQNTPGLLQVFETRQWRGAGLRTILEMRQDGPVGHAGSALHAERSAGFRGLGCSAAGHAQCVGMSTGLPGLPEAHLRARCTCGPAWDCMGCAWFACGLSCSGRLSTLVERGWSTHADHAGAALARPGKLKTWPAGHAHRCHASKQSFGHSMCLDTVFWNRDPLPDCACTDIAALRGNIFAVAT